MGWGIALGVAAFKKLLLSLSDEWLFKVKDCRLRTMRGRLPHIQVYLRNIAMRDMKGLLKRVGSYAIRIIKSKECHWGLSNCAFGVRGNVSKAHQVFTLECII